MSPQQQVTDVSLVLKDSDMDSENLSSLIWLSVSDGQKTDSSKVVLVIGISQEQKSEKLTSTGPGRVAQSVTCLVTDAKLTADPGVASSIPARSHTFVEIDHEIISTVILLPSAESLIHEGLLSVTSESMCTITG